VIPDVLHCLTAKGYIAARVERWQPSGDQTAPAAGLLHVSAVKPATADESVAAWMYRGPAAEVELEDGRILRRAERTNGGTEVVPYAADFTAFRGSV
jgi:hypothetical protein